MTNYEVRAYGRNGETLVEMVRADSDLGARRAAWNALRARGWDGGTSWTVQVPTSHALR